MTRPQESGVLIKTLGAPLMSDQVTKDKERVQEQVCRLTYLVKVVTRLSFPSDNLIFPGPRRMLPPWGKAWRGLLGLVMAGYNYFKDVRVSAKIKGLCYTSVNHFRTTLIKFMRLCVSLSPQKHFRPDSLTQAFCCSPTFCIDKNDFQQTEDNSESHEHFLSPKSQNRYGNSNRTRCFDVKNTSSDDLK